MQNEFLHFNAILTTTTTNILYLIYYYNPPKRFAKFENIFLAGIITNTWQAEVKTEPILKFYMGLGPT
jgi:hypothetical protein